MNRRGSASNAVGLRDILAQYLHLLLLIIIRHLLKAVSYSQLNALLTLVGLSALLAEAEEPFSAHGQPLVLEPSHTAGTLLPPRPAHDYDRLTVVLDLDETLVCAYNSAALPPGLPGQGAAQLGGMRCFSLQCLAAAVDKEGGGNPRGNSVTVYERPGLSLFLARLSEFAEVVLFTAGLEGYAQPLIDRIDPHGRIAHRLYRPATVTTPFREHVKDLSRLGRDLRRCVLVDNNPFSFCLQPSNGVPCVPFTGHHAQDRQLLEVVLPLLEHLDTHPDVRPLLDRHFHMDAWFQSRGLLDAPAIP